MKAKRLRNAPLPCKPKPLEDSNEIIAKRMLQRMYEKISDRFELEQEEKEDQEASLKWERCRSARLVAHWKRNPISEIYKERGCTILRGFSEKELFIDYCDLERIRTSREFYRQVRMKLQLLPEYHLKLLFVDSRRFGRRWTEHIVPCDDRGCLHHYLDGSVLRSIVDTGPDDGTSGSAYPIHFYDEWGFDATIELERYL